MFTDIGSFFTEGFGLLNGQTGLGLNSIVETVGSMFGPIAAGAQSIGSAISSGVVSFFPSIFAGLGTLVTSVGGAMAAMMQAIAAALSSIPIAGWIAAAAAVPDPLIAPNNIFPTTFVCARDPGNFPDNSVAKLTNFMAIPPLFIIIPASTKNGIANSENEFIPVNIRCAAVNTAFSHGSAVNIDNTEDIPIVTEIGIPISSNTGNTANKINPVLNANSIMFPLNLVYFMQFYFYFLLLLHHLLFF